MKPIFLLFAVLAIGRPALLAADVTPSATADPKHFVVTEFGAVADGTTLNTAAIQKAIDAASANGGGVVEIPKGTFRSGSIFLGPHVELYLNDGAILLGSNRIEDYPVRQTRIEGHFQPWRMALVNVETQDGVRIRGKGKLDGNGILFWAAFWQRRKENPHCTNLEVERPRLMFIDRCTDVLVEGVTLQDSGFWNLHLYACRDVRVEGVRINAPTGGNILGPSTDGIDVDSCQHVEIRRCRISVNDDNIALKGSKGPHADQDKDSPPVEDILVEECEFGDGNGVVTCGSEATIVRRVTVRNCTVVGRTNVLTLKLRPDTPQHYSDILIENVKVEGTGRILNVASWTQFFDLQGQPPPSRSVERVTLRHISGSYRTLGVLRGNPGDVLRDITLEDVNLTRTDDTLALGKVENFVVKDVVVNGKLYQPPPLKE
jgi:polygalacturonase